MEVFRIAWKNSMSSYRQALKTARTEYIRKLIDNHQNNPRFLFGTVARLTNKQMSPDLNIPSQFNSNDFMNFFTDKIDNIRNTITNVDSTASSTSASFIAPKEKLHCFTTIGQDELNKLITASKTTTCLLDPVPTKLLKELLPVAEEPLLNIIEEVQTFLSLIAEERIQRELDGTTPKEKALCITLLLNLLYFQSMFSVYIFTSVSVFCFN